ncbi:MAG: CDP-diacylglycerol--glycerol-3-phosphate 3-phosphatidyltransferase [Clostridiales bacterium]|nr:CDP-diacylglycerol--glycerol-3-phosphate 3-phosphatidyltransferase [Clostridiales bacterium]
MNLPNKLTVLRMVIVPFFVFFLLADFIGYNGLIALVLFVFASLTDLIDGKIARKHNLITNFGKFLDPLADKALVISALICFVELGFTQSWVVIIIIMRELLVTSLRLLANGKDSSVIAAGFSGKVKTTVQMVAISLILLFNAFSFIIGEGFPSILIGNILMYIACAITIYSGIEYLFKYRSYIDFKN